MSAAARTNTSLLQALRLPLRPASAAAIGSAAAAAGGRGMGPALLRAAPSSGRLAMAAQRLVHSAAVVCSAAGDGVMEVVLKVDGMVCDGCSSRVQEVLEKMAGVKKVSVDLETGLATVAVEAGSQLDALTAVEPLAKAVQDLGFDAAPHFAQ